MTKIVRPKLIFSMKTDIFAQKIDHILYHLLARCHGWLPGARGEQLADPFRSKSFKKEKAKWNKKLEKSGFIDIEDARGNLKSKDNRTSNYRDRENVRYFFGILDWFMNCYQSMPKFDRRVMQMYSDGEYVKDIVKCSRSSDKHVRNVIKRYRGLVLAIIKMLGSTDNPHILKPPSKPALEVIVNEDRIQDKAA